MPWSLTWAFTILWCACPFSSLGKSLNSHPAHAALGHLGFQDVLEVVDYLDQIILAGRDLLK